MKTKDSHGFSMIAVSMGLAIFAATAVMLGQGFSQVIKTKRSAEVKSSLGDIESALAMGIAQRVKAHAVGCTSSCAANFITVFNTSNVLPGIGTFTVLQTPAPTVPNSPTANGLYSFRVSMQATEGTNRILAGDNKVTSNFINAGNSALADQSVMDVMIRIVNSTQDHATQLTNSATLNTYKTGNQATDFYFLVNYRWTLSKGNTVAFVQTGSKKLVP